MNPHNLFNPNTSDISWLGNFLERMVADIMNTLYLANKLCLAATYWNMGIKLHIRHIYFPTTQPSNGIPTSMCPRCSWPIADLYHCFLHSHIYSVSFLFQPSWPIFDHLDSTRYRYSPEAKNSSHCLLGIFSRTSQLPPTAITLWFPWVIGTFSPLWKCSTSDPHIPFSHPLVRLFSQYIR